MGKEADRAGRGTAAGAAAPARASKYHHGDLRNALLAAAEAELVENDIEGFTLRGVAKRAGVSHAAPAHYFKDTNALLTALAELGFRRFLDTQRQAQADASPEPRAQMLAAGLGYVDFALANPELFRLIFSSQRPDFGNERLASASREAFQRLLDSVGAVTGADPARDEGSMLRVIAAWSIVHGLAGLLLSGHLRSLSELDEPARRELLSQVIGFALTE